MKLWENVTIGKMLAEVVRRYPQRHAVEYLGKYWNYKELDDITDKIAQGMLEVGITKGSRAAIWAKDCPNTLFCFLALEKIGGIPVMLNTSWTMLEVRERLSETEVEYLLYDEGYKGVDFVALCKELELPLLRKKIYIGLEERKDICSMGDTMELEAVIALSEHGDAEALHCAKEAVQPTDVDVILFTSGSTSSPKGVVTTHFSRVNNVRAQAEMLQTDCHDIFCQAIPMFHCFSLSGNVLAALAVGACICFPQSRKTDHIFTAIERVGCTILTAVPTLYSALLANSRRTQYDISGLRTGLVGGAGCSEELFARVCDELHIDLLPSLGQTEATAGITAGRYEDSIAVRATTVGYLLEHVEGKIIDIKTKQTCKTGDVGELCIRGYNVMQGYYNQPELTRQTIDEDGFLHTGDMGYFDKSGRLYLTGRLKELIIRGGENITPGEIEQVIAKDSRVAMVKVVGVKDDHYGEEICACIECVGESLAATEVQTLVAERLADYKVPKYVIFLERMPLMGNGKIDAVRLKKIVEREIK